MKKRKKNGFAGFYEVGELQIPWLLQGHDTCYVEIRLDKKELCLSIINPKGVVRDIVWDTRTGEELETLTGPVAEPHEKLNKFVKTHKKYLKERAKK